MPSGAHLSKRIFQSLTLAIVATFVLALALNTLSSAMGEACRVLIGLLGLDASIETHELRLGNWLLGQHVGIAQNVSVPDWFSLGVHWVITLGILAGSLQIRSKPVRSALQLVCVIHAIGLMVVTAQGNHFPYTPVEHTGVIFDCGLIWLFATPWLLAAGFYLVERSWRNRLLASALILGFQLIALPLKLTLHALLIALLSPAAIPTLFIALGPILDVILFGALNAWVMAWPTLRAGARK